MSGGTVQVIRCSCGGIPAATTRQVTEDCVEAVATCKKCGKSSDPIEHVWGGLDARLMAYEEWNHMRRLEIQNSKSRTLEAK